eukprot:scaffold472_cov109-Isochrysis_galbana.AAC.14
MPHRKHRAGAALQEFRESCDVLEQLVAAASAAVTGCDSDTVDAAAEAAARRALLEMWNKEEGEALPTFRL